MIEVSRHSPAGRRLRAPNVPLLTAAMAVLLIMVILGPMMTFSTLPLAGEGNPLRQLIYVLVLLAILVAIRPLDDWSRLNIVPIPIWIALAWCWASIGWSIAPDISFRRITLTTILILSIFLAVRQLGYRRTVALLRIALALTLVVNYAAVLLFPDYAIHQFNSQGDKDLAGTWRGIMEHKNFAGAISALLIPFMIFDAERINKWLRVALIAGAAAFVYFSHSKTSLGLVVLAVLAGLALQRLKPNYRALFIVAVLAGGVFAGLAVSVYNDPIHALLRDPEAFTGRTNLWRPLLAYSEQHRLLGSGFGAFWNIGPASPVYSYAKGWIVGETSGHNGFLDMMVQVGVPGLALILFATLIWPFWRILSSTRLSGQRVALVLALLMFCITHNSTESSLFDRDAIVQIFLMIGLALLVALRERGKQAAERGEGGLSFADLRQALR